MVLASGAAKQKNTKMPPNYTNALQTHFGCRSKVNRPSPEPHYPSLTGHLKHNITVQRLTTPPRTTGKEAGQAFERSSTIQLQNLKEPDDAANTLIEAYKSYRKTDPEDAARCLEAAIKHYTSKGNFRRAAQYQQNLAELYEGELEDGKRALEAYDTAAGWFEGDGAEALANKLYIKGISSPLTRHHGPYLLTIVKSRT